MKKREVEGISNLRKDSWVLQVTSKPKGVVPGNTTGLNNEEDSGYCDELRVETLLQFLGLYISILECHDTPAG